VSLYGAWPRSSTTSSTETERRSFVLVSAMPRSGHPGHRLCDGGLARELALGATVSRRWTWMRT